METAIEMQGAKRTSVARLRGGFGAGVGASIAMMGVMALLRFTTNTTSIPELMEDGLLRLVDGKTKSDIINALGVGGKALLLVSVVEGTLLLGGLLGWFFTRFWPHERFAGMSKWVSGLLYGLVVGLGLNAIFLPVMGQGFFGSTALSTTAPPEIAETLYGSKLAPLGLPAFLSMFVLSLVFGLALVSLLRKRAVSVATGDGAGVIPVDGPEQPERRNFVKVLGGGALALFGGGALWVVIRQALEAPPVAGVQEVDIAGGTGPTPTPDARAPQNEIRATPAPPERFVDVKARLVPEITPTENFYITTKNIIDPTVDGATWTLKFTGLVENPYSITLADLKQMEAQERTETLACISNPVGGDLIGNGKWRGVDFTEMLRKAKPRGNATEVILRAADGYTDSITLDVGLQNGCFLAYEMNGTALTQKHGYPARLLVPNIYGMKNVKWITEVELASQDHKGYWESQGWSDSAVYMTMSRIDYPENKLASGPVYVGGVAFAGSRGIQRVEVSTDGGKSWGDATLRPSLGKDTWTQWAYPWIATSGEHKLLVRATDGTGQLQTAKPAGTYPDGATGWHSKTVLIG
ncbi:MAG: molybdopterin-dependent oxidoreductase [Chloroflexia bacterium]